MRVLFFYHLALEFPGEIESRLLPGAPLTGPDIEITVARDRSEFESALPNAEVLIAAPQPGSTLERAASLRFHIIPFAGVNRAPLAWYRDRGVLLASSHGNAETVAERAVALMFAAAGRVVEFDRALREGRWHRRNDPVRPFEYWRSLAGARVAILGAGSIGTRIAELIEPLVGEIVGFRRGTVVADGGVSALARSAPASPFARFTGGITEALEDAEVVFVTLPLTADTRGVLTRDLLSTADSAVFVNVSRAEIIAEEELYTALTDGTLGAAGLDVWYRYPDPPWAEGEEAIPARLPFHLLDNVVLSPHAASHTESGKRGQLIGALDLLEEFVLTGSVSSAITAQREY